MVDISRLVKNFDKAPFSTPRTHRFLRGKIPAERHWDRTDFGQWNKFPPVSGWNFPFPEAEASAPRAGNNSPLVRAKSCSGSNFFYQPPAGRGGARGTVFGVCKVFFSSTTRSKLVPSSQLGTFCSEVSELGAAGARLARGFPAWSRSCTRGRAGGWSWVSLPGSPAAQRDKPSPPFCCWRRCSIQQHFGGRDGGKKPLSLVKGVFLLGLRPCRGNAEEPKKKPPLYSQGIRLPALLPHGLSTSFKEVWLHVSFFDPTWGETSKRDSLIPTRQWQAGLGVCTGTPETHLDLLPVGTSCSHGGGGPASPNSRGAWEAQPASLC